MERQTTKDNPVLATVKTEYRQTGSTERQNRIQAEGVCRAANRIQADRACTTANRIQE
jgi:hypothetical protein